MFSGILVPNPPVSVTKAKTEEAIKQGSSQNSELDSLIQQSAKEINEVDKSASKTTETSQIKVVDAPNTSEQTKQTVPKSDTQIAGMLVDKIKESSSTITQSDYGIAYKKARYIDTISGVELLAEVDGQQKIIKLIGIDSSENDASILKQTLMQYPEIYLEFDAKRYDGDKLLAYVWVDVPNMKTKDKMINVALIQSGYAKYVSQSPNIKYNYYFLKIQPK